MTSKQRIMRILTKGQADYVPWTNRIEHWYSYHRKENSLPQAYRNLSLWDVYRKIGSNMCYREGKVFVEEVKDLAVGIHYAEAGLEKEFSPDLLRSLLGWWKNIDKMPIETIHDSNLKPSEIEIQYLTSVGQVSTKFNYPPHLHKSGMVPYQTEHMIKSNKDCEIAAHIIENTEAVPAYDDFLRVEKKMGEDGVVFAGAPYCPMHEIMLEYLGYEKFFYDWYDHPKKLYHLLEVLTAKRHKMQEIFAQSPATLIMSGGNFDARLLSPSFFRRYFVPYFARFADLLHGNAKILLTHTDGEMKNLLGVFLETGIDVAEAFTPSPMTSCTLADARKVWGSQVTIWGGVPSVMLSANVSEDEFRSYMNDIFRQISPGDHFILEPGDDTPIDADLERLITIDRMVKLWS